MLKSARLKLKTALPLMRLMTDVASLKNDPPHQRQVLIDGLQRIFKTKLGWFVVADNWRPRKQTTLVCQVLTSDMNPDWVRYMADFTVNNPVTADMYSDTSINCNKEIQTWHRRKILKTARARKQYAPTIQWASQLQVGDDAVAAYRTGTNGDRIVGFSLHRDIRSPRLTAEEDALVRLAIEEIRELERRGHLSFRNTPGTDLPPRLAQILDRLISGKTPKQIATELDLSLHTVREYVQSLYQRFNVAGREELMARFAR